MRAALVKKFCVALANSSERERACVYMCVYLNDLVHLAAVPLIRGRHVAFVLIRTSVAIRVGV